MLMLTFLLRMLRDWGWQILLIAAVLIVINEVVWHLLRQVPASDDV